MFGARTYPIEQKAIRGETILGMKHRIDHVENGILGRGDAVDVIERHVLWLL
jgi:hypothetical protein